MSSTSLSVRPSPPLAPWTSTHLDLTTLSHASHTSSLQPDPDHTTVNPLDGLDDVPAANLGQLAGEGSPPSPALVGNNSLTFDDVESVLSEGDVLERRTPLPDYREIVRETELYDPSIVKPNFPADIVSHAVATLTPSLETDRQATHLTEDFVSAVSQMAKRPPKRSRESDSASTPEFETQRLRVPGGECSPLHVEFLREKRKIDRGEERVPSNDGVVFYRSQARRFGNFTDNHNRR